MENIIDQIDLDLDLGLLFRSIKSGCRPRSRAKYAPFQFCVILLLILKVDMDTLSFADTSGQINATGFNTIEMIPSLNNIAVVETCNETVYEAEYLCGYNSSLVGFKCVQYNSRNKNFGACWDLCLEIEGGTMLTIHNDLEYNDMNASTHRVIRFWIGGILEGSTYVWKGTDDQVEYFHWALGQPTSFPSDGCLSSTGWGYNDLPCYWDTVTCFCETGVDPEIDLYHFAPPSGRLQPAIPAKAGRNISVICTDYILKSEKIYFKYNRTQGNNHFTEIETADECIGFSCNIIEDVLYHANEHRCIKRTTLKLEFEMWEEWQYVKHWCCRRNRTDDRICVEAGVSVYFHEPSRPNLTFYDNDIDILINTERIEMYEGSTLKWTCECKLGSGHIGTVALISEYGCGSWAANYLWDRGYTSTELLSGSSCSRMVSAESSANMISGNVATISAEATMTEGNLEGAVIGCYSYDATSEWKDGLTPSSQNSLAAFSPPITLKYNPRDPELTVNYHGRMPDIYKGYNLSVTCDAFVGSEGGIAWTLRTQNGIETYETSYFGKKAAETPPHIRIDHTPKTAPSCSIGWRGNVDSATCVKSFKIEASWEDARKFCKQQRSDLMRIASDNENKFVKDLLTYNSYWIGLADMDEDGIFIWFDDKDMPLGNMTFVSITQTDLNEKSPKCVYIQEGQWFTYDCSVGLLFLCETEPGTFLNTETFNPTGGPKMHSVFSIIVNESLESATLECKVINPRSTDNLEKASAPFVIKDPPVFMASWKSEAGNVIANMACAAYVGPHGSLSLVIFSGGQIKYMYIVDSEKQLNSVKPAPKFDITEMKVAEEPTNAISVKARLQTKSKLEDPFMICYPFAANPDEELYFDDNIIQEHNRPVAEKVQGEDNLFSYLAAFLALILLLATLAVLSSVKHPAVLLLAEASKGSAAEDHKNSNK